MDIKKVSISVFILLIFITLSFFYLKSSKKNNIEKTQPETFEENSFTSNIIQEVNYTSKDSKGNEYVINAETGEIDINNSDVIYLTNVEAIINLKNSEKIYIQSDYGRYNSKNFDTIFSKNVIIEYLDHEIKGEYLDFSLQRNLMVISRNIVYTSFENILKADVLEMNIQTKDTIIYMYEEDKKVNIKSKN